MLPRLISGAARRRTVPAVNFQSPHLLVAKNHLLQRQVAAFASSSSSIYNKKGFDDPVLTVSILGPPNAGKSTLFNRLVDRGLSRTYKLTSEKKVRRKRFSNARLGSSRSTVAVGRNPAIVSSIPGTTRDRKLSVARLGATVFHLYDTAGMDASPEGAKDILDQNAKALQESDLILLLLDGRLANIITSDLQASTKWLRRHKKSHQHIVVLANKLEGYDETDYESYGFDSLIETSRLGFGNAIPISAVHGDGIPELARIVHERDVVKRKELEEAAAALQEESNPEDLLEEESLGEESDEFTNDVDEDRDPNDTYNRPRIRQTKNTNPLQLAILGRPNVGKSTLVNALLKQERVLTGPNPGVTRDAIQIKWTWEGRPVQLVDTAGIRQLKNRRYDEIEDAAVMDAVRAMKVADVAVLVLDAAARRLSRQDLAIADAVIKEGRALIVVANKMDLLLERGFDAKDFTKQVRENLEERLPMLRMTPVIAMSSLHYDRVDLLMPVVFKARDRWERIITTGVLNRWLREVILSHPPPMQEGIFTKLRYVCQTKGRPPTFLIFGNVHQLPENYIRYLTRNFQETFEYFGMEIRLAVKKSSSKELPSERTPKRRGFGVGGREGRRKRFLAQIISGGKPQKRRRKAWKRVRTKRAFHKF